MSTPHLFMSTTMVGRNALTNFEFDPEKPYTFCCICGALFQDATQRLITPDSPLEEIAEATSTRRAWALRHAKTHPEREHEQLRRSGRAVTPEAAMKLVPYGISPLTDMVLCDEHEHAALIAPRRPHDDAEAIPVNHVSFSGVKNNVHTPLP